MFVAQDQENISLQRSETEHCALKGARVTDLLGVYEQFSS